mmetsp:Transcript_17758/g.31738  ORF Transcript_17758/g.31738 Transcript_17758/m.31738 type:complete len:98 (+) Transcript_17758:525-818(+)
MRQPGLESDSVLTTASALWLAQATRGCGPAKEAQTQFLLHNPARKWHPDPEAAIAEDPAHVIAEGGLVVASAVAVALKLLAEPPSQATPIFPSPAAD